MTEVAFLGLTRKAKLELIETGSRVLVTDKASSAADAVKLARLEFRATEDVAESSTEIAVAVASVEFRILDETMTEDAGVIIPGKLAASTMLEVAESATTSAATIAVAL